jgi:hypothetical protein
MLEIFPCNFLYHNRIENHEQIKEKYLSLIECDHELNKDFYKEQSTWACNISSNYFGDSEHNISMFDDEFYHSIVWSPLKDAIQKLCNSISCFQAPSTFKLTKIWYNAYTENKYQECHEHGDSNFSGIYIMSMEEKNKTLFFQNQLNSAYPHSFYCFDTLHIEEGSVIIFPSSLLHSVSPCEKERVTVSFNITAEFG